MTGQGQEWYRVPAGFTDGWTNMVDDQGANHAQACEPSGVPLIADVCTTAF